MELKIGDFELFTIQLQFLYNYNHNTFLASINKLVVYTELFCMHVTNYWETFSYNS